MRKNIFILISLLFVSLVFSGCSSSLGPEPEILASGFEKIPSSSGFLPQGQILAGSSPYYIEFKDEDFKDALKDQKLVILNFYANWCPSCKAEDKEIRESFKEDNLSDSIVVFRVNFKDSDTSDIEKSLAEDNQVITQGTKVIFVDGKQVGKTPQHYSKDQYLELFSRY